MVNPSASTEQLAESLAQYWGYDSFRPLQREAMEAVMAGRESVVVLPTGGGKSLCFQAPAACMEGVAVVVSPLISLMKDQVDALRECGIPAAALNSSLPIEEKRAIADQARSGELKLLYAAPERLLTSGMLGLLTQIKVSFVAIDEAHCISSWGHDFRPEYRGLRQLKEVLPDARLHAYTATAPERVRHDIAHQLGLREPEFLVGSFDRPNLVYRVHRAANRLAQVQQVINRHSGESGIVYCISRKEVERIAEALSAVGVKAQPYHAGLSDQERKANQEAFIEDRTTVIVATVAFGMGIDKPDVRFVVHSGMPKSIENYQQESGRAGRDGLEAECVLLFGGNDAMTWKKMTDASSAEAYAAAMQSIESMSGFASTAMCRHKALVEHFGQAYEKENCGACDVCLGEVELVEDSLIVAQKILSCVARLEQKFGADYTTKVLAGSGEAVIAERGHNALSTYGLLKAHSTKTIRDWVEQLVAQKFLAKGGEFNVLGLTEAGVAVLKGQGAPRLTKPAEKARKQVAKAATGEQAWEGVDRGLFDALRELRAELAREHGVPAYIIFGDASLREMARDRPTDRAHFATTRGVGKKKLDEFCEPFTERIASYSAQHDLKTNLAPADPDITPAARGLADGITNPSAIAAMQRYARGETVDEVAAAMDRARSTAAGYLQKYLETEAVTDPSPWVDSETARRIEEAIEQVGLKGLSPIYQHLNEEIDYEPIKIVAACVANRQ